MESQAKIDSSKSYADEIAKFVKEAANDQLNKSDENDDDNGLKKAVEDNETWVFDYTRAIILSHISKIAQEKNFYARA